MVKKSWSSYPPPNIIVQVFELFLFEIALKQKSVDGGYFFFLKISNLQAIKFYKL